MPNLLVSVAHQLSQDEALQRVQRAIVQAKSQNSDKIGELKESWDGYVGKFRITVMGHSASGSLTVNPSEVTVEGTLPLIASPFRSTIEARVRDMLARLLA